MCGSLDGGSPGESWLLQVLESERQSEPSNVLLHVNLVADVLGEPVVKQTLILGLSGAVRKTVVVALEVFVGFRNKIVVESLYTVGGQLHVGESGLKELVPVLDVDALVSEIIEHAEHQGDGVSGELYAGQ